MKYQHPLHRKVAVEIRRHIAACANAELLCDPACDDTPRQRLPLFIGAEKGRDRWMCNVDLLVRLSDRVRVIVEIEESSFRPTTILGKFLQAALADHFIHDKQPNRVVPYGDRVLFVQVLDGKKCLKSGSRKDAQAELITWQIRRLLPLGRIAEYGLFFVREHEIKSDLAEIGKCVALALKSSKHWRGKT